MAGGCGALRAQSTEPVSAAEVKDISLKEPQEDSPFFIERQEAKAALAEAGREGYGMYVPKPPHPPIKQQMKKFFHGMFGSLKLGKNADAPALKLTVDPSDVSLSTYSELDVTLKITNARRQMLELLYPTNQRLEILTKDSKGEIVGRWSQDRAFDPVEGFVAVNPEEYVSYTEKIPTSVMKAGESYTIEVSLAGQEDFTIRSQVTAKP